MNAAALEELLRKHLRQAEALQAQIRNLSLSSGAPPSRGGLPETPAPATPARPMKDAVPLSGGPAATLQGGAGPAVASDLTTATPEKAPGVPRKGDARKKRNEEAAARKKAEREAAEAHAAKEIADRTPAGWLATPLKGGKKSQGEKQKGKLHLGNLAQ